MRGLLPRGFLIIVILAVALGNSWSVSLAAPQPVPLAQAATTVEPYVAIHVSELTQALETMPAVSPTPTNGATGFQWWQTAWSYESIIGVLEEALRSDGVPFVIVSDADIQTGLLCQADGAPRFPIVISLASEATTDDIADQLHSYVDSGGMLFLGSSALTRFPDGSPRGNFALAAEMGLNSATASLENWAQNLSFTRQSDHRLVSHIPTGNLTWSIPASAEEKLFDIRPHLAWQATANGAEVLATSNTGPLLAMHASGNGQIIYISQMQPLLGHGGYDNGMYSYLIFRKAIEWAFERLNVPLIRLSAWPYPYDAAFNMRHDFENFPALITSIESSAQYEYSLGVKGDYYFTTGVLRAGSEDHQLSETDKASAIASLRRAVSLYGATIGSHNGGLANPLLSMQPDSYNYWHWGPDEVLDITPDGYSSGQEYAYTSMLQSFHDIEGWLAGLDNGRSGCGAVNACPRLWVSPAFMSTREGSYDILSQLNVSTAGEQKIGIFPHWTVSNTTRGKTFSQLSLPVSEWYVGSSVAQALDYHNINSVNAAVDFYYDQGAFINLYGHNVSNDAGSLSTYLARVLSKPRIWSTNAIGIYDWWVRRSAVSTTPTYWQDGGFDVASVAITGAVDPQTTIELALPNWNQWGVTDLQVLLNGIPADSSGYRFTKTGLKVLVGTSVNQVDVRYRRVSSALPTTGLCLGEEVGNFNIGIHSGWTYHQSLLMQNPGTGDIPAGYTARLTVNTSDLVVTGKMRADGNDLRVVWTDGVTAMELDRLAETPFNQTATEIAFKLQVAIPAGSSDGRYFLYYGNLNAGEPPADPQKVYAVYETFDGSTLNADLWRVPSGSVNISSGQAYLPTGTSLMGKFAMQNALVEIRLRLDAEHDFAWWGLEENPNSSSNFVVFEETSDAFWVWSRNNWTDASRTLTRPASGLASWHTYTIDWYQGSVTWLIDGAVVASISSGGPLTSLPLSVNAFSVPVRVDWVKARLRATQDTVVSFCPGGAAPTATPTNGVPTATNTPLPPTPTLTPQPPTPTTTPGPTLTSTQTLTPVLPTPTSTFIPMATPTPPVVCVGEESGSFVLGSESVWLYRSQLHISNPGTAALPAGYAVRVTLDSASLTAAGKLRLDGNDLRIVWNNAGDWIQLDRVAETSFTSNATEIWFQTQESIAANGGSASYHIYYGNSTAGQPPANPANVYTIWDDFTGAALNSALWTSNYGSPGVSGGYLNLPVSSNIFGQNRQGYGVVEMRLRMGAADQYAWWGFEENPLNGANFLVFEETDQNLYVWTRGGWLDGFNTLAEPAGGLTEWHTYTIRWQAGSAIWLVDGMQVAVATNRVPTVNMYASMYGYGAPLVVDWVKVRPLAVVEPVVVLCTATASTPTPVPPTATSTPIPTTATSTNTPLPPTATSTNTPLPPTATSTNTPLPPTATSTHTPLPPTATSTHTPLPPTATSTHTPLPPTATSTNTPLPPTATSTHTLLPPTATSTHTPLPPTATSTHTPLPPTATSTNTPLPPTATSTHTLLPPTPTNTPTATATPTVMPTAVIFVDGFESGNLSAWTSSVIDGGDMSIAAPGLEGVYALRAVIDDTRAIYVRDSHPANETHYLARILFDPNSIVMTSGNAHYIFFGYAGSSTVVLRLEFRYNIGLYQVRANVRDDASTWYNTAWVTISDAPHRIELNWRASSEAGANDGGVSLAIDGTVQATLNTIDNDTRLIDLIALGPISGLDKGTRGTYYFDSFESYR